MASTKRGHVEPGARPGGAAVDSEAADTAYRRAWWSLALYPVSFGAAFGIGEGIITALTNDTVAAEFWQMLVAVIPALLVFAIPGILSVLQGRKAMRLGRKDGRVPAIIGAGIAVGFVMLNVASYFFGQPTG
jgi:hypothetical protein